MPGTLQAQRAWGRPERQRLATWRGGYHGDTFHPMSVCDPVGGMHRLWTGVLPRQIFADVPPAGFDTPVDQAYVTLLGDAVGRHAGELAAVIVEPVVQGAGGMRFHHPGYLRALREITEAHGVLLILDEIATGFGRTGALFAADHAGVSPDIMCVGKALTGGYLTLAAALCTPRVASPPRVASRTSARVLGHGGVGRAAREVPTAPRANGRTRRSACASRFKGPDNTNRVPSPTASRRRPPAPALRRRRIMQLW